MFIDSALAELILIVSALALAEPLFIVSVLSELMPIVSTVAEPVVSVSVTNFYN